MEIDGGTHFLKADRDAVRQQELESLGVRFLRYTEKSVRENPWAVAQAIDVWIDANPPGKSVGKTET